MTIPTLSTPVIELTTISLTPDDAKLFLEFQKRYAFMQLMASLGVFDVRSGSVTINFDALGRIGNIDIQKHYRL